MTDTASPECKIIFDPAIAKYLGHRDKIDNACQRDMDGAV